MSDDQLSVPALPVLIPLGLLAMVVSTIVLVKKDRLTPRRIIAAWGASAYFLAVLGATLLPLSLSWGGGSPDLYRILLVPVLDMRPVDFVLNTMMTLPLAAALFLVAGIRSRRRVVLTGFLLSLTIETIQAVLVLWFHGNRWADVNDLMSNTLGTYLGHLWFWSLAHGRLDRWTLTRTDEEAAVSPRRVA